MNITITTGEEWSLGAFIVAVVGYAIRLYLQMKGYKQQQQGTTQSTSKK